MAALPPKPRFQDSRASGRSGPQSDGIAGDWTPMASSSPRTACFTNRISSTPSWSARIHVIGAGVAAKLVDAEIEGRGIVARVRHLELDGIERLSGFEHESPVGA